MSEDIVGFVTLQMSWGGLFDSRPADGYMAHLVRSTKRGTPGPTLCGIDRFAKDAPGWSVRGGISGPKITHTPCDGCVAKAAANYPDLPVGGLGADAVSERIQQTKAGLAFIQPHHHAD